MSYGRNLIIALDQLLNAATGGKADETLSSRWGRTRHSNPIAGLASRILDKIDPDHAWDAIERKPGEETEEPHHMGGYEPNRKVEEAALGLALERDDVDDFAMGKAEVAAKRQRFREAARDKARGGVGK